MSDTPSISVVMPVYNSAPYLGEAVESILGQTLTDFEFIIIDDGSTDGSGEILDQYAGRDNRIRVFHQENRGVAASLNRGLEASRGKYIARMDADDISLPERLERQVGFMEARPEVGLCGTACRLFGESAGVTRPRTRSGEIKAWLIFGPCMAHPTVMMRRSLVLSHGLHYDIGFEQAEDYDLWFRFSLHSELANLPDPLLLYRVCAEQLTSARRDEVWRWSGLVQRKALGLLGIEPTEEEMELHHSIHTGHLRRSRDYVNGVEAWLMRIVRESERARAFEGDALDGVISEIWRTVCVFEWELGPWIWSRYIRSSLRLPRDSSTGFVASCLRSAISAGLQRSGAGRSLKRVIRGLNAGGAET